MMTSLDDTALTAAYRAYKAGAMDWSDVQAIQASLMPRCADHDRPATILLCGRPVCPVCQKALTPEELQRLI